MELSQSVNDHGIKGRALSLDAYVSAELGDRARVDRSLAAVSELGEVRQHLNLQWASRHGAAMLAILDGNFAAAEDLARDALKLGCLILGEQVEGVYGIQMFSIRREQGRLAEVAPVVKRLIDEKPTEKIWLPGFALIAADLGFAEPARRRLHELAETGFDMPFDAKRSASLSYVAEVASLLGDSDTAERLYELMSVYRHMNLQPQKHVEFLGGPWLELPEPFHHRRRVGEFKHDRPAINDAHRMGAEEEAGHDAEVSAAAQSPQQVRVPRLGSGDEAAVSQNHVRLKQAVNREAVLAAEIAVTAAQRQARDTGRRYDPERHGLTEGLGRVVDVAGRAARPHSHARVVGCP